MAALAALAADRAPGALIFTTRAGGPLDSSHAARHWLTPAAQAAAVGRLGWHALRHSYVTTLARRGVSPAAAQRLAGHASIAVTLEVYTHLDAGDLDAAVDAAVPALAAVTARGS